jgi:cell division protein ZapA (FtsZ GTPase activity inhibitor)
MMDDKLSIKVNLAERYYPLKIDRGDEEKIRRAARMINEKVLQYKQKYADKDTQDFMAMAALQFVIKIIEGEGGNGVDSFEEKVSEITDEIKNYLEKSKNVL